MTWARARLVGLLRRSRMRRLRAAARLVLGVRSVAWHAWRAASILLVAWVSWRVLGWVFAAGATIVELTRALESRSIVAAGDCPRPGRSSR